MILKSKFEINHKITLNKEKNVLHSYYTCDKCGEKICGYLSDVEMKIFMDRHNEKHIEQPDSQKL